MRFPQLLIHESDGRLAALLRPLAEAQGWTLREPRQMETCLRLLPRGGPGVLVIKLGRHLEREFMLLERVRRQAPTMPVVVVADSDHPSLVGLGWDLGAAMVLAPPLPREALLEVVTSFLSEEGAAGRAP